MTGTGTARRRLFWITDVPTPYRAHLFRAVDAALRARGIDFQVGYMARSVSYRHWNVTAEKMPYRHAIARGLHLNIRDVVFHFNPGLVWNVWRNPCDWLILGSTWWMPTAVVAEYAARRHQRCKVLIHAEANRYSMRHKQGPVGALRRSVLCAAGALVVPGQIARDTIEEMCGDSSPPLIQLPNLVDEALFGSRVKEHREKRSVLRSRYQLDPSDLVLVWPARLDERLKGISCFLQSIPDLVPTHAKIVIAGDGPDRQRIERWVSAHLPNNVRLLGQQSEEVMLELLGLADALLLPSLEDPNPLSVIEALWAELPVLISNRCGNSPEAVDQGRNGWVVDPHDRENVRAAASDLFSKSSAELQAMGAISRQLAETRFSTPLCVEAFLNQLETI
jgi:glycosyltransferase involved in cell wall biosynthesis